MKPSKRTRSRRSWVAVLDDAARRAVFERDGFQCVAPKNGGICGERYGIQWSHIFSREDKSTRWMLENAVTFCGYHHQFWWHKHPAISMPWFELTFPERYAAILAVRNQCRKVTDSDIRQMAEAL